MTTSARPAILETHRVQSILRLLPHRYPFLFVDRVDILVRGEHGIGTKLFTVNEPFFQGHFPDRPVVPGVILGEAAAQTIAVVYNSGAAAGGAADDLRERVGLLAEMSLRFTHLVEPGDAVEIEVRRERRFGRISSFAVRGDLAGGGPARTAFKGTLTVTERHG